MAYAAGRGRASLGPNNLFCLTRIDLILDLVSSCLIDRDDDTRHFYLSHQAARLPWPWHAAWSAERQR